MEAKTLDVSEFRDGPRQQWNSAAIGWRKWSEQIDAATSGISERLIELAGFEPGSRVLDVASGYGEPSLTAAEGQGRGRRGGHGHLRADDRELAADAGVVRLSNLALLAAGRA